MPAQLAALASALRDHKTELVAQWQAAVRAMPGAAKLDGPALRDHIPQFIDAMIAAMARQEEEVGRGGPGSPVEHGLQRLAVGFDIKEVVLEYSVLREAVHEVAEKAGLPLRTKDCRALNHLIDDAIARAVDTFANEQGAEMQRRREEHFAFVAHDVRTPLHAIGLAAAVLTEDLKPEDNETRDMLRVMQRNVERIRVLIRRFMDAEQSHGAGKAMRLTRREIDLWPLVYLLFHDLRAVTDAAEIRTANKVPRDLTVDADADLLVRVLQNLLGNSVKFTPGGEIEIGARALENGVECWVKDTGTGIPADRIGRIFDKLETDPDPARAGAGLGLAICKQIVEAHGGTISVASQPGLGSTFTFTIPPTPPQ